MQQLIFLNKWPNHKFTFYLLCHLNLKNCLDLYVINLRANGALFPSHDSVCNKGDTILRHGGLHTNLNQCNQGSQAKWCYYFEYGRTLDTPLVFLVYHQHLQRHLTANVSYLFECSVHKKGGPPNPQHQKWYYYFEYGLTYFPLDTRLVFLVYHQHLQRH